MRNYKPFFLKAISKHFPGNFDSVVAETDKHYRRISVDTQFASISPNPIDRRLDFCAYFLALIITLDQQGHPYERIKEICLEITTDYVKPKNKLQQFFKRLPPLLSNTWLALGLIKILNKKVGSNPNPDGFIANIITDKKDTYGLGYGIDIVQCGICKLFKKHNYEKYSSILCEVDELTSALAGLKLVRTGTIALGANKCDFRFMKVHTKRNQPGNTSKKES